MRTGDRDIVRQFRHVKIHAEGISDTCSSGVGNTDIVTLTGQEGRDSIGVKNHGIAGCRAKEQIVRHNISDWWRVLIKQHIHRAGSKHQRIGCSRRPCRNVHDQIGDATGGNSVGLRLARRQDDRCGRIGLEHELQLPIHKRSRGIRCTRAAVPNL